EDHVGMRLREVRDLPDPLAEPRAREASRSDADRGLHDLEARALRVGPRVQEAEEACAAVRLEPDRERPYGRGCQGRGDEKPHWDARDEEDREHHPAQRDGGSEIRLDDDEPTEDCREQPERLDQLTEGSRRAAPCEVGRPEEAEGEFRELGRLEARGAEDEPAARAVDRRTEQEDRRAEAERDEDERWCEIPEA